MEGFNPVNRLNVWKYICFTACFKSKVCSFFSWLSFASALAYAEWNMSPLRQELSYFIILQKQLKPYTVSARTEKFLLLSLFFSLLFLQLNLDTSSE